MSEEIISFLFASVLNLEMSETRDENKVKATVREKNEEWGEKREERTKQGTTKET